MDPRVGPLTAIFALVATAVACDPISERVVDEGAGLNGGFEVVRPVRKIAGAPQGLPVNWSFHGAPIRDGDASVSLDPIDAVEGRQSLRLDVERADSVPGSHTAGIFQVVPAEPLHSYRVSYALKAHGARAAVVLRSESPSAATPGRFEILDEGPGGQGTWRRFEYVYRVPEGFENLRFEVNVTRPGTLWIDDIRIEEMES